MCAFCPPIVWPKKKCRSSFIYGSKIGCVNVHTRPHVPCLHPCLQYVLWAWNRKRRATRKKEIHSNAEWKLAFAPKMHLSNAWMVFNDGSGSCWFFIMQSWRLLLEMGTRAKTHPISLPCRWIRTTNSFYKENWTWYYPHDERSALLCTLCELECMMLFMVL